MQLNLNKPMLNINQEPIEFAPGTKPKTVGQLFADVLVNGAKGDILKFHGWGMNLAQNKPLTLDVADVQVLKAFLNEDTTSIILLRAQVLNAILEMEKNETKAS